MTTNDDMNPRQPDEDEPIEEVFRDELDLVDEAVARITDAEVDEHLRKALSQSGYSERLPNNLWMSSFQEGPVVLIGQSCSTGIAESANPDFIAEFTAALRESSIPPPAATGYDPRARLRLRQAQKVLDAARRQAKQIIAAARDEALNEASQMIREARKQADWITFNAQNRADQITFDARCEAHRITTAARDSQQTATQDQLLELQVTDQPPKVRVVTFSMELHLERSSYTLMAECAEDPAHLDGQLPEPPTRPAIKSAQDRQDEHRSFTFAPVRRESCAGASPRLRTLTIRSGLYVGIIAAEGDDLPTKTYPVNNQASRAEATTYLGEIPSIPLMGTEVQAFMGSPTTFDEIFPGKGMQIECTPIGLPQIAAGLLGLNPLANLPGLWNVSLPGRDLTQYNKAPVTFNGRIWPIAPDGCTYDEPALEFES